MSSTTSSKTIDVLRTVFTAHGLPDHLVSDNGPQFTSEELHNFFVVMVLNILVLLHIILLRMVQLNVLCKL